MQVRELLDVSETVEVMRNWCDKYNDEASCFKKRVLDHFNSWCKGGSLLIAGEVFMHQADYLREALKDGDRELGVMKRLEYLMRAYDSALYNECQLSMLNAFGQDYLVLVYPGGEIVTENKFDKFSDLVDHLESVVFGLTVQHVVSEIIKVSDGDFLGKWLEDTVSPEKESILPYGHLILAEAGDFAIESGVNGVSLTRYWCDEREILKTFNDLFDALRWLKRFAEGVVRLP